jgi:hypothetical protein
MNNLERKSRFKVLYSRVLKNGVELGADLAEIKENDLWVEGGFNSWADLCNSVKISLKTAWQLIQSAEIQKTLPEIEIPNPSVARELGKIALPQRRQVAQEAISESGGKMTAKSVKKAAKKLPGRNINASSQKDGTGLPIPPEIQTFWNRNEEADFLLSMISKVRLSLENGQKSKDLLFRFVAIQYCVAKLKMVAEELQCAKSYAVCPKCNGILFESCPDCRNRGTLPKFNWNMVPEEIRNMRNL